MAIKTYKPTTPSRRNMSVTDYSSLSKVAPERSLLQPLNKKSGRNSYGIVARSVSGGAFSSVRCGRLIRKAFATGATF